MHRIEAWRSKGDGVHLVGAACAACGGRFFPYKELCPDCGATSGVEPAELAAGGVLYSYSVVWYAPAGFKTPYVVGFVDLDDGVRVFAQIECDPAMIELGQRMSATAGIVRTETDGRDVMGYKFRSAA